MKFPNPFRRLFTEPPADFDPAYPWLLTGDVDGAWWCSYGTRHAINEHCTCTNDARNVLVGTFPDHGGVLTAAQTEAEIDDMAEIDAFDGVAPLMAHSVTILARRLMIRSVA